MCADLASRGRLRELHELCAQLSITPTRVELPEGFLAILARFRASFGPKPAAALRTPRSAAQLSHERRHGRAYASDEDANAVLPVRVSLRPFPAYSDLIGSPCTHGDSALATTSFLSRTRNLTSVGTRPALGLGVA